MTITPLKSHKITIEDKDILKIIDKHVPKISENSILVVTSKIVSICEGSVQKIDETSKDEDKEKLVRQNSEHYIDKEENQYGFYLTVTNNLLIPTAGIDESNGNGYYVLWPKNPQLSANKIREFLARKFKLKNFGVIITDSKTTPLRWGTTGVTIAHSGFSALNDYMGKPDLFGREMRVTKANIADGLAAGAVAVMGEGQESTPFALISHLSNVAFQDRNPTDEELQNLKISIDEDVYAPILKRAPWKKGLKS